MFKTIEWIVVFFAILVNLLLVYHTTETMTFAMFTSKIDLQIFSFLFLSFVLISTSFYFLIKTKNQARVLILLFLATLQLCFFRISFFIPTINKNIGIKHCIDSGKIWDNGKCK